MIHINVLGWLLKTDAGVNAWKVRNCDNSQQRGGIVWKGFIIIDLYILVRRGRPRVRHFLYTKYSALACLSQRLCGGKAC